MIGNIAQFWRLTRELDVNSIREDFERGASLRVLGSDRPLAERVARLIDPTALDADLRVGTLAEWGGTGRELRTSADAYVVAIGDALDATARRALTDLTIGDRPVLLVQFGDESKMLVVGVPEERVLAIGPGVDDATARDELLSALVRLAPQVMLPLGRRYPHVREAVATHLIRDTSRVNAQFAALSSLPANIPLVGGVVGDMADILVLTKNQVILLFKLAGLYGRDLALGRALLLEVLPVVGGAFLWRSTARALVGLLPGALSLLPKAIVAYSGTFVVGETARYYYQSGGKPSAEMARDLSAEGLRLARATLDKLRGPRPEG